MGSRRGSANIWGRFTQFIIDPPLLLFCTFLAAWFTQFIIDPGVIGWLEVGSPVRDPGS